MISWKVKLNMKKLTFKGPLIQFKIQVMDLPIFINLSNPVKEIG